MTAIPINLYRVFFYCEVDNGSLYYGKLPNAGFRKSLPSLLVHIQFRHCVLLYRGPENSTKFDSRKFPLSWKDFGFWLRTNLQTTVNAFATFNVAIVPLLLNTALLAQYAIINKKMLLIIGIEIILTLEVIPKKTILTEIAATHVSDKLLWKF